MSNEVLGVSEANKRILNLIRATREEVKNAVLEEAKEILELAKERTPVKTGDLKASGRIIDVESSGSHTVSATIGFGGPTAGYAIFVHEDLEAKHPNGGQAKFLESAVQDKAEGMSSRLRSRILRSR